VRLELTATLLYRRAAGRGAVKSFLPAEIKQPPSRQLPPIQPNIPPHTLVTQLSPTGSLHCANLP